MFERFINLINLNLKNSTEQMVDRVELIKEREDQVTANPSIFGSELQSTSEVT